jgi:hypothetical protein
MPTSAVPAAPIPVHTALAGPTSSLRSAMVSSPKVTASRTFGPAADFAQILIRV